MRAIWKGAVSFGLVSIAVKLYSATEEKSIRFHQVHRDDGGRIRYQRVCSVCGKQVEYDDIAKGYDLGGGEIVVLTDEDFADLPLSTSRAIDVLEFVPAEQIDPILFNKSYYLEPEGTAAKPYVLLRDALVDSERVAGYRFGAFNDLLGLRSLLVLPENKIVTTPPANRADFLRYTAGLGYFWEDVGVLRGAGITVVEAHTYDALFPMLQKKRFDYLPLSVLEKRGLESLNEAIAAGGVTRADGAPLTGQLDYPALRRTESVTLDPEHETELAETVAALSRLAEHPSPPERHPRRSFCRRCAFEDLCYG